MGKQTPKRAKLLYKKSNCTFNTISKTSSDASQFLTKNAILQLKKRKAGYYVDNGIDKRDLSIETDICILRRYYKTKLDRFKYSTPLTEAGAIDESKGDRSACGDSNLGEKEKAHINIDITTLVVENLKDLLSDWIKKYMLNNDETKQKIETVLDSIFHNLEIERNSSTCTYTLDITVDKNKRFNSGSVKNKVHRHRKFRKRSCQTVPVTGKYIRLISTLSIPRNINREITENNFKSSQQTKRTVRCKNVFLTVSRSSKFMLNSSSFNLLSISTKSFTRRCATYYRFKDTKSTEKKPDIALLQKSSNRDHVQQTAYENQAKLEPKMYPNTIEIDDIQSLVKSIYADDPANITSTETNLQRRKNDNYTMTDTDSALKNVTSDQFRKLNWKKAKFSHSMTVNDIENIAKIRRKKKNIKLNKYDRDFRKTKSRKKTPCYKFRNKNIKHSTNVYRKDNSYHKDNKVIKDIHNILDYFAHYTTNNRNIKFEIKINVVPLQMNESCGNIKHNIKLHNNKFNTAYNIPSQHLMPKIELESVTKHHQNASPDLKQESEPKLISLLDGAISQSKYVISKGASYEVNDNMSRTESDNIKQCEILQRLEISKGISELRDIIKELATATEKFVKEHMESIKPCLAKNIIGDINQISSSGKRISKCDLKRSIGVQSLNHIVKSQIISGLKLIKRPKKKDMLESQTRLAQKSVSYNVIDSESILKVTDMTSAAADISNVKLIDKALNCSLPKSNSQFEISVDENKRKLLAYYCDKLVRPRPVRQHCNVETCSFDGCRHTCPDCPDSGIEACQLNNDRKCYREKGKCHAEFTCVGEQDPSFDEGKCRTCDSGYTCSSIYIDVEDRSKKFSVKSRSGVGFWEGFVYCILLWIPVVVICCLIYVYVIKDIIQPTNPAIGRTMLHSKNTKNNSIFQISLSDLGF